MFLQFVDSVILMRILRSLNRRVSWLMAEKSFERPFIGRMARSIGALPVSRAMDVSKPGKGTIFLPEPKSNPRLLKGIGTDFTSSDYGVGFSLYLPLINGEAHKLDISEIQGPEAIILKAAPISTDIFFQLTGSRDRDLVEKTAPGFRGSKFKVAPRVDQTQMYQTVFNSLQTGGCVGIFPEGGSHDR
jgi:glycerol-3-phosphate O-acyltransferase/dihydroxyacetone phosphate acyltransferase